MTSSPGSPLTAPRRSLRISLRGLMLLVLLVGGGIGWQVNRVRTQRLAVEVIQAVSGSVLYDYEYDYEFSTDPERRKLAAKIKDPVASAWLRRWLGDDFFRTVVSVNLEQTLSPELLATVARLDGLVSLGIGNSFGAGDGWRALTRLTRLEAVWFVGAGVNDSALAAIGQIPALRSVRLVKTSVTDQGITSLAQLPELRSLDLLVCSELTDAGVARVLADGAPSLEDFFWSRSSWAASLTVAALAADHPGLRRVSFSQSPVEDADLAPIGALTGLLFLNLQQTHVTDAGLVYLEPLGELESLTVNLPGVTDSGMKSLGKLKSLKSIDLSWSKVGDAGLAELIRLPSLIHLTLRETEITDAAADSLGQITSLERLNLMHTRLTDAALVPLEKLSKLQSLAIGGTAVTAQGVARLQTALPGLTILTRPVQPRTGPPPIPQD